MPTLSVMKLLAAMTVSLELKMARWCLPKMRYSLLHTLHLLLLALLAAPLLLHLSLRHLLLEGALYARYQPQRTVPFVSVSICVASSEHVHTATLVPDSSESNTLAARCCTSSARR